MNRFSPKLPTFRGSVKTLSLLVRTAEIQLKAAEMQQKTRGYHQGWGLGSLVKLPIPFVVQQNARPRVTVSWPRQYSLQSVRLNPKGSGYCISTPPLRCVRSTLPADSPICSLQPKSGVISDSAQRVVQSRQPSAAPERGCWRRFFLVCTAHFLGWISPHSSQMPRLLTTPWAQAQTKTLSSVSGG